MCDYLAGQGRFAHLQPAAIEEIQKHVDEHWRLLGEFAAQAR